VSKTQTVWNKKNIYLASVEREENLAAGRVKNGQNSAA